MKHKTLTSFLLLAMSGFAFGEWSVEYTFDGGTLPEEIFTAVNREASTEFADVQNGMLRVNHGDLLEQTSNLWVMAPLSADLKAASIAAGGPVTCYFEMIHPLIDGQKAIVDVAWGLANIDPDVVLEERYDSFNAMQRIDSGDLNYELRDGGSYVEITQLEADVKYQVWMVVDYTLNFVEFYIKGGQYTEQTNIGLVAFRVNPDVDQTVDYFTIGLSSGNSEDGAKGIDYMYFDNIAIDTGAQNLSDPPIEAGEMWAGFPVLPSGDCNTGDWLGWLWVGNKPYIYSYSLQQWLYIEEDAVGSSGSWIYVYNL